ncbi:APC family permease [Polyangium jinanense]|uniref:Amino acid permease n=1 Tax=Polyangium jinanense TaxID=2829994 RepID=A0A9X4AWK2_9BACT|nr:amino acid permease [Polyangium jinanense]MDC3960568.1 amino acid permease [Polyangium jinanense]MDC3985430.1 amino acid permease [Polyangium jinanense]
MRRFFDTLRIRATSSAGRASERDARGLSVSDGVYFVVGIVIGAGIFKTPSLVAANVTSARSAMLAWVLGGVASLLGALCYAELASTYPHKGGDYHYLTRAFGGTVGFLFAWSRMTVIQTGSITMQAFLIGDYASRVASFGPHSASVWAALVIALLTGANIAGLKQCRVLQRALTAALVLGLVLVVVAGLVLTPAPAPATAATATAANPAFGLAMVFVLLTYGGWNEAAYLSAELRGGRRAVVRVLVIGIGLITAIYLAVNLIFLRGLGFQAIAGSDAVAADLMRRAIGPVGVPLISILVSLAALSTMNATIFTGARTTFALGQSFAPFRRLGRWHDGADTPRSALVVQGAIALALVLLGDVTRGGFVTMVEYTAPVFWGFLLLVGLSLFVLRKKDPDAARPFRVPLYPLVPVLFCGVCLHMLRSSLAYTGIGALVGVGVLLAGVPVLLLPRARGLARRRAAEARR